MLSFIVFKLREDCRDFLQIVSVPVREEINSEVDGLMFDAEWLAIVRKTHGLLVTHSGKITMPSVIEPPSPEVSLSLLLFFENNKLLL
jgi:hypothetical protein